MALTSVSASSNPRRPKAFAIRSSPPGCVLARTFTALPAAAGDLISDQMAPPTPLISPAEPTSCGPGSDFFSYRGKVFKPPIAFAIRKFPKGCGPLPLAARIPKPSDARRIPEEGSDKKDAENSDRKSSQTPDFIEGDVKFCRSEGHDAKIKVEEMEEKLSYAVRGIPEEGSCFRKIPENALVGKSLGGNDGEKPTRKSSVTPDFVKDGKRFCRPEGSEAKKEIGKMEKEMNDVVRRTPKEGSDLGKALKNVVVEKSLGGKDGKKPFVKDGKRFFISERSEFKNKVEDMKEKSNNVVRRISKEGTGLGKVLASDVVGRSLGEKDGRKPDRKRSLVPDSVENGRSEGGQPLEVRGERLIVLALMAAKRCPWMQGKGKGSIGLQSRQKKPRIRASG